MSFPVQVDLASRHAGGGFPPGSSQLDVGLVDGMSTVLSARSSAPVRLLTPRSRGSAVWAFLSGLGGGLVGGDETAMNVQVGPEARCLLGTPASVKVYRNASTRVCRQNLHASVSPGGLLVCLPDMVQPFAGSSFEQRQIFRLATGGSLVLLDGLSSGRQARGERWAFNRYASRNDISVDGQCRFWDSVSLDASDGPVGGTNRMGRFNAFVLMVLMGPMVAAAATMLLARIAAMPVERQARTIVSAGPLPEGAVLRMASESVESALRDIRSHLEFVSALVGDNPFARKW